MILSITDIVSDGAESTDVVSLQNGTRYLYLRDFLKNKFSVHADMVHLCCQPSIFIEIKQYANI